MSVHANENNGAITLTIHGRHRNIKLEAAEQLLEELEKAIAEAKSD
jgi:DNA-binding protein YbaB